MSAVPVQRDPRHIHVLFVHGVGTHSRLSSLLQAYQAFRSNLRSPEAPIAFEDPIPDWDLKVFDDRSTAPYIELKPKVPTKGRTESVYLYEVNYSALAGVIRDNQPLDITRLFVGLDLAVNVARTSLQAAPPPAPPAGSLDIDHVALAQEVQALTGVLVAATVPILGVPSLIFRSYTKGIVATFTRFFSDVATFALDGNGKALISAHLDRTVEAIFDPARFAAGDADYDADRFVIVAHSLGTIVSHDFLVRHWHANRARLPQRLLTFGSPIGLVCWMWLFLDFDRMRFDPANLSGNYFCWTPHAAAANPPPLYWINVVNYLDPIATAFPVDYVDLAGTPAQNAGRLAGGLYQRFIGERKLFAAAAAHTSYFDEEQFREIVGRIAGVRRGEPHDVAARPAAENWTSARRDLGRLGDVFWAAGLAFIGVYFAAILYVYRSWWPLAALPLFLYPPLTIGVLAFWQRLAFGWPTKRTAEESIDALNPDDLDSWPYRARRFWHLYEPDPLAAGPGLAGKLLMWSIAFVPPLLAMALPPVIGHLAAPGSENPVRLVLDYWIASAAMLALVTAHFASFALREFVVHWGAAIRCATTPAKRP